MRTEPWFKTLTFFGAEEEKSDTGNTGNDNSDTENKTGEGNTEPPKEKIEDIEGLKSALAAERKSRRELERAAAKRDDEDRRAKQTEEEQKSQLVKDLEVEKAKNLDLAQGFLKLRVNEAILREASKLKFHNSEDAVSLIDSSSLIVDQDETTPSRITIDSASVAKAVKALADAKPHLINTGGNQGPSGSQFGNTSNGGSGSKDYGKTYSAL